MVKASVKRVIDGDTIVADLDLGFGITLRSMRLRLYGVDTPELGSKDAEQHAKAMELKQLLEKVLLGRDTFVSSVKTKRLSDHERKDGFGRYIVVVHYVGDGGVTVELNQALKDMGYAKQR